MQQESARLLNCKPLFGLVIEAWFKRQARPNLVRWMGNARDDVGDDVVHQALGQVSPTYLARKNMFAPCKYCSWHGSSQK